MVEPVRLKVAFGENYAVSGMTFAWTRIYVNIKNITYTKKVQLHYKGFDGLWRDFNLPFVGHYGNFDVFGSSSSSTPPCNEFVVRYVVSNMEFWDDNSFENYKIGAYSGCAGGNVMLKKAVARTGFQGGGGFTFQTSWLEGEIYVFNKSYHKRVVIHYTTDNWFTFSDVEASYAGQEKGLADYVKGVEIWKFKTPELNYNPASDIFRFAVYYEILDPGMFYHTIFWDNNFEQDYELSKVDGTKIGD